MRSHVSSAMDSHDCAHDELKDSSPSPTAPRGLPMLERWALALWCSRTRPCSWAPWRAVRMRPTSSATFRPARPAVLGDAVGEATCDRRSVRRQVDPNGGHACFDTPGSARRVHSARHAATLDTPRRKLDDAPRSLAAMWQVAARYPTVEHVHRASGTRCEPRQMRTLRRLASRPAVPRRDHRMAAGTRGLLRRRLGRSVRERRRCITERR